MKSHFFAMHSRMKYIYRWALMRNTVPETLSEHSGDVAAISHALALIKNKRFSGDLNADRAAVLGLYHDMPEIITGDMPTPVKYHSRSLRREYEEVENHACRVLTGMLPDYLRGEYESFFFRTDEDEYLWKIVKAADKISALKKCIEEKKAGNSDFDSAYGSTLAALKNMHMEEVDAFLEEFAPSFSLTLDEMNK